jgi:23S rRNA-/tRNA-specific pseudouridylate synthase
MWLVHAFRKDSRTNTAYVERIYSGPDRPDLRERRSGSSGRPVICRARVLCTGSGRTLFALELIGGQSHQLRAQIAAEGYPISGDRKYAGSRKTAEFFKVSHPLLHAYKLLFNGLAEPFAAYNGQIYTAQPPADMMRALRTINASPDTVLQDAGFAEESNPTAP